MIKFSEVPKEVNEVSGIYEIHTNSRTRLKVGISENLQSRLMTHGASRQSALKLTKDSNNLPSDVSNLSPSEVESKGSILAKHLFFDESITKKYDLKTEEGRQGFLEKDCYILYKKMTFEKAKIKEKKQESSGKFRYVGVVKLRNKK